MDKTVLKANEMETQNITKLILKYSLFTFAALFFNELYNIIDTLFVSRGIGDNAMGGVSIIFPFMMIQGAVSQTIGAGAASIISRMLGKKEYDKAGNITANAMFAFYTISIVITAVGLIFINPLLQLFGATDDIMPYAKEYFTIILLSNVFSTGFSSIIRAEGKMLYSLLIWLIPTVINIALDAVLIYALHMGVQGAALATAISYFSSFIMSVIFFKKLSLQSFNNISFDIKIIKEIIALGIPMLLQLGSVSLLFMVTNKFLSYMGGTASVNTFAYISKIITFIIVPFNAVAMAASPIISYSYGAKNTLRTYAAFKYSILICEIYSAIAMLLSFAVSDLLMKIFTSDYDIISYGETALQIAAPALLFVPITIITGSYFQAIGKKAQAIFTNSLILIFFIAAIFILSSTVGINGIYIAIPISCLLSCIISLIIKKKTTEC